MPGKVISSRKLGAVVFIAALVTFAGKVGYGYVWDDPYLIGRIREAISTGEIAGLFTSSFYPEMVPPASMEVNVFGNVKCYFHACSQSRYAGNIISQSFSFEGR